MCIRAHPEHTPASCQLGERVGITFRSVTPVMVAAWTSEALHAIRLHPDTFRSLAPDPAIVFDDWWSGRPTATRSSSTLIVLDPAATGRQRTWIDLETALAGVRPRLHGYAELAAALRVSRR